MALQKTFTTNQGVEYNYHKALKPNIKTEDNSGSVIVVSYLNHQARIDDLKEIERNSYNLPSGFFDNLNLATTDPRDSVYLYLKTLPVFTGAIDIWTNQ